MHIHGLSPYTHTQHLHPPKLYRYWHIRQFLRTIFHLAITHYMKQKQGLSSAHNKVPYNPPPTTTHQCTCASSLPPPPPTPLLSAITQNKNKVCHRPTARSPTTPHHHPHPPTMYMRLVLTPPAPAPPPPPRYCHISQLSGQYSI